MPQITNKEIWEELQSLNQLIRGHPDEHRDSGLIGAVHENTKFRRVAVKFTWFLVIAVLALWGNLIAQIIMNGGN